MPDLHSTLGIQWIKRCCVTAHDGEPARRTLEGSMAKGHAATKRKRRHKSGNRKDSTAATMAKLRHCKLSRIRLQAGSGHLCRPALAGFIISSDSERGFAMSTLFIYFPDGKTKGYTGVESILKVEDGVLSFFSQPDASKKTRKKVQTSLPFLLEQNEAVAPSH